MIKPGIPASGAAITADWMQRALRAGGAPNAAVEDVSVEIIGTGVGLLGEIARCRLAGSERTAGIPETVIVKLPSPEPKSRRMSRLQALYKREYAFYRHVGPHAPVRSPRLLYGDYETRSDRFVLVLEDLGRMRSGDELAGANPAEARSAIRAIARLHGHYWDKVGRPPMSGMHDPTIPRRRPLLQAAYLAFLVPTLEQFGSLFSAEMRRLAEEYGARCADHVAVLAAAPQTFTHGDFRLDNMFFGSGDAGEVALLDWQVSGLGNGLYDVAYFLGGSVSVEVRREMERDLIGEYTDIVCSMGARDFDVDDCWRLYRQNMLARLLITVFVCGGLDLNDERMRRLVEIVVRRTLTAIDDLDAGEFLPAPRPLLSASNLFSSLSRLAYRGYRAVR